MKTKRNNVGKMRRMVGGLDCKGYNFNITDDEVKAYVERNYTFIRFVFANLPLTLIGFGIVLVTNASKYSWNKKYNRPEQVAIFKDTDGHIYIARGNYPYDNTKDRIDITHGVYQDVLRLLPVSYPKRMKLLEIFKH
jgi:hypothetical protein